MNEPLNAILSRLQKPLRYALQDNSVNLGKVQGLPEFVARQVDSALSLDLSEEETRSFAALRLLFADFDRLSVDQRRRRLAEAEAQIDRLSRPPEGSGGDGAKTIPAVEPPPRAAVVSWEQPAQYLKGVGPRRAEGLARLGIKSLEDLLYNLPWRYEDRSRLKPIAQLAPGEDQTVTGTVQSVRLNVTSRRRFKIFEMIVGDASGSVMVKWFNQPYLQKIFQAGQTLMLTGKVRVSRYRGYGLEMENPIYEIIRDPDAAEAGFEGVHTGRIVPIYHETRGWTSRMIRSTVKAVLDAHAHSLPEILPADLLRAQGLSGLSDALSHAHFPPAGESLERLNQGRSEAHRRLVFEEFLLLQLGLALKRREAAEEPKGTAFRTDGPLLKAFLSGLPYCLTGGQSAALEEIKRDMARPHPMNRLLQGDVGCGKTAVAAAAMMIALDNGWQAALMAPTEILADQHFKTLRQWAEPLGIPCRLLTGGRSARGNRGAAEALRDGDPVLVVGTHALIQQDVQFGRLGLVVVDEQHKFGVMQRAELRAKGYHPDVLIMTATPIPRTLALTVHGDLDLSVIRELPKGRAPVRTRFLYESKRSLAYSLLAGQITQGRQAYIVYPLVEESEKLDLKAAVGMADHLRREVFPGMAVGLLHGRMPAEEKEGVMGEFKAGRIPILVSTTVVEVGVDVPNATVMIIEHAERFGLSQLHQLRGRIGRGAHESLCLLMAGGGLSDEARRRLETMVRSTDGFVIAEEDLAIRGPGEFFGTRQSGIPELRVANLIRDGHLLETAREEAAALIASDPRLLRPEHAPLRTALARKWRGKLELFTVS